MKPQTQIIVFALVAIASYVVAETKIQVRQGLENNLPVTASNGELLYTTDSHKLFVGTSSSRVQIGKTPTVLGNISTGHITADGISISQGAEAQSLQLLEALINGSNSVTIKPSDALSADHTLIITDSGLVFDGSLIGSGGGSTDISGLVAKTHFESYSSNRQIEISRKLPSTTFEAYTSTGRTPAGVYRAYTTAEGGRITRYRFERYSTHVAATYTSGAMLVAHNTADSSHSGHFVAANPHSGSLAVGTFDVYTSTAFKTARFVNFSTHWGKSDTSKLDTTTFNLFESQTVSALATKTPHTTFNAYTSSKKNAVKGDTGARGYDGRNGKDGLSCRILDGFMGLTYDKSGALLTSTLPAFSAYLYDGATLLTSGLSYSWYIPAVNSQLTWPAYEVDAGQLHRQTFAPGAFGTYSASKTINYVRVQGQHSSTRFPFGKRTIDCQVTVAINKQGDQGIQGIQGAEASVTRTNIFNAMSSAVQGEDIAMQFQPLTPGQRAMVVFRDYTRNVRQYTDSWGYQYYRTPDGDTTVVIQSNGAIYVRKGGINRVSLDNAGTVTTYNGAGQAAFKAYSSGRTVMSYNGASRIMLDPKRSSFTTYRSNGNQAFRLYSTSVPIIDPGVVVSDGLCLKKNVDGSFLYGTCGTGGSGTPGGSNRQFQYNNAGSFAGSAFVRYSSTGALVNNVYVGDGGKTSSILRDKPLEFNTTGYGNIAIGNESLYSNSTGYRNAAIGIASLYSNTSGSYNVGIGYQSGAWAVGTINNTDPRYSSYLGYFTQPLLPNGYYENIIGAGATGSGSYTTTLGGSNQSKVVARGAMSVVNKQGVQIFRVYSSGLVCVGCIN